VEIEIKTRKLIDTKKGNSSKLLVKKTLLFISISLLFVLSGCEKTVKGLEEKALGWIHSQVVPNKIVKSPSAGRRNLIISYEVPKNDEAYRYTYSRSFIYDGAVAAIALSMCDQQKKAGDILEAFARMVNDDGSLFFSYNTHNYWPNQDDHEGAIIRIGALAWVGYANVYYLNERKIKEPDVFKRSPRVRLLTEKSMAMANYIISKMVQDREDKRYGLVKGGYGEYKLKYNSSLGKVVENFIDRPVRWCSTEHNIDSYFFLRDIGRLTGDKKLLEASDRIKKNIILKLWDDDLGQFIQGIKADGRLDKKLALDCASWGSLFLCAVGDDEKAKRCLETGAKYRNIKGIGYRPYRGTTVYEDPEVNAFFFPSEPKKSWDSVDIDWFEGTLGMIAGYLKCGLFKEAGDSLELINKFYQKQRKDGLPYSSSSLPYLFNTYPSVASTSWYLIVSKALKDESIRERFCSK
jgi:hypothetical protein